MSAPNTSIPPPVTNLPPGQSTSSLQILAVSMTAFAQLTTPLETLK